VKSIRLRAGGSAVIACVIAMLAAPTQAQTYTVLYKFTKLTNAAFPYAGVIQDAMGNLYGTTTLGGPGAGTGTIFKLSRTDKETVLYRFKGGPYGEYPQSGLIQGPNGNLYGTTPSSVDACCGTVFKLNKFGKEHVLYLFTGGSDGSDPLAGLTEDSRGNLYGTTFQGGNMSACPPYGCGVVYKVSQTRQETVLHAFMDTDGKSPQGGVVQDASGNLYGTTYYGGLKTFGTVFKLSKTGKESVLHNFRGSPDGANPAAGLMRDAVGNLYGTTYSGGSDNCGTIFKVDTAGKTTVMYSFETGGSDGCGPLAGLTEDSRGNLYGTTAYGGSGFGVIFKLSQRGKETVLHRFTGGADGGWSFAGGVILDAEGNLYGTAQVGGDLSCNKPTGCGIVFKLTP
jgi:uncharacterized repeat protein (TIGR03803 family)